MHTTAMYQVAKDQMRCVFLSLAYRSAKMDYIVCEYILTLSIFNLTPRICRMIEWSFIRT